MNAMTQMLNTAYMVERMSNNAYHNRPEFSSSQLKDLLRSGAHFYVNNVTKEAKKESSAAMNFGTLIHTMFLEPECFNDEFVIAPEFNRRTKDGKAQAEAWEAANVGKMLVTQEQVENACRAAEQLRSLSSYKVMQNNYCLNEASIFFTDPVYGLQLRIRPDSHIPPCHALPNGLILDVKSTTDARPHGFSKKCADFAYDLSAAMYQEGFQQYYNTEQKPDFLLLVAESSTPFNVKQYKADDIFLAVGAKRYEQAKEKLAESLLLNEWDGYSTELEEISLPNYLVNKALDF